MSCASPATGPTDSIEHHPPERRRRKNESMVVYMCCCTCCCCLHTVGGTVGALVAGGYQGQPGYPSSQSIFWKSFVVTVCLTAFVFFVTKGLTGEAMGLLAIAIVMAGPLFLLGASLVMLFWLVLRADLPAEGHYWRNWGRITFGVIIGTCVGFAAMYIPYVVMAKR